MSLFQYIRTNVILSAHQYGLLLVILATILFSSKSIIIKLVYNYNIEPAMFMSLRMLISMPIFLWVLYLQKKSGSFSSLNRRLLLQTILFGISGYYVASYLDLTGLLYLSASLERLVLYSYPSIVLLLSALFLRQRLTLVLVFSLLLVYLGLIVVFLQDITKGGGETSAQLFGATLVFCSAIAFAIYFVGSEIMMRKITSQLFTTLAMLAASVVIMIHYFLQYDAVSIFTLPAMVYFYGVLVAIFCTVLPSFLLSSGISRVGAASGSIVGGVGPVMTLIMAFIFLDESITVMQACGFALVIAGIWNLGRLKSSNHRA